MRDESLRGANLLNDDEKLGFVPDRPTPEDHSDLGFQPTPEGEDLGFVPEDPNWLRQRRNEYERGVAQAIGMGSTAKLLLRQKQIDRENRLQDLTDENKLLFQEYENNIATSGSPKEDIDRDLAKYRAHLVARQTRAGTTPEQQAAAHAKVIEDFNANQLESAGNLAAANKVAREIPTSAAMREFQQSKGVLGVLGAVARNPVAAPTDLMAGSLPAAAPGMAAGALLGSQVGPAGTAAGAGLGSFSAEYLSKVLDVAGEMGVDVQDPEALLKFFNDPAKLGEASGRGIRKGIPVAVFDAFTGGMAGKFLEGALGKGWKQVLKATAKESGTQIAGGMAGEATGELAAGEKLSAQDILAEGIAELPGGLLEVRTNLRNDRAATRPTPAQKTDIGPSEKLTAEMNQALQRPVPQPQRAPLSGSVPEPGIAQAAPSKGLEGAATPPAGLDSVLAEADAAAEAEAAERARVAREREQRQADATARREAVVKHIARADELLADPAPGYGDVTGTWNALEAYRADNSLGLTADQRTAIGQRLAALKPIRAAAEAAETARRNVEAERLAAEQKAEAERRNAAIKAEKEAIRAIERTGRDPRVGNKIVDLRRVPTKELEVLAMSTEAEIADHFAEPTTTEKLGAELYRREGEAERGAAQNDLGGYDLLEALRKVKLPVDDAALGGELKMLLNEEMTPAQRLQFSIKDSAGLDRVAEQLRADYGFANIRTPADVIEHVQRALRGERVRSTGLDTSYATTQEQSQIREQSPADGPTLSEQEKTRVWDHFRRAFPQLTRQVDLELALSDADYAQRFTERGVEISPQQAESTEAAMVPAAAQTTRRAALARRDAIIFSGRALQNRKRGSARAVHEVAHSFWWALPETTREILTDLHRQEIESKTGPLFDETLPADQRSPRTDLKFVADLDERGVREWFAERVARLNEAWAEGRIERSARGKLGRAQLALHDAWEQVRELMRRVFEAFVRDRGQDPESEFWQREFRRFMLGGTQSDTRTTTTAAAYAEQKRTEFAARRPETDFAEPQKATPELDDLQQKRDNARIAQHKARTEFEGHDADRMKWQKELDDIVASDREDRDIAGRHAEQELRAAEKRALAAQQETNRQRYEAERLEQAIEKEKLTAEGLATKVLPPGTPETRRAALQNLREKLQERLATARKDQHDAAGFAIRGELLEVDSALDREFPGWREKPLTVEPKTPGDAPVILDERRPEDGQQNPQQEATEYPVRAERFDEVEGQSFVEKPLWQRGWSYVRDKLISGFKGAIPELPTFPAAWWNKDDPFTRGNPTFYNRLREGWRQLKRATPDILRTAEEQTAAIVQPLLNAARENGRRFDAKGYARLQKLQADRRAMLEDGRRPSAAMAAEIHALNSKFENDPYTLFGKLVMYLDLQWRWNNLKSDQGEPITLPGGLNIAEIEQRLGEIKTKIDAGNWSAPVAKALQQHIALVRDVAAELKTRELWPQQALTNPFYFPHLVLEKQTGRLERVKIATAEDFRGYLLNPVGSNKPIETDYLKAMYYHLVQVGAHNRRADVVREYFKSYDAMEDVRKAAKQLSAQRGVSVNWRQAFHEQFADAGYVLFTADPGSGLMPALTVDRDKLAFRLGTMIGDGDIQTELEKLGVRGIKILPEDVHEALTAGEKEYWIVPEKVADALRGMTARERETTSTWGKFFAKAQGLWKGWTLFAPWNYLRYEYGNTLADIEKLFSADPKVFANLPRAAREVRAFYSGEGEATKQVRAAFRAGVLSSVTAEEIGALPELAKFEALATTPQKVWNWIRTHNTTAVSQLREATFRYAKFLADLERLENGARPVYAGAYWKDIDAIRDSRPGAADANVLKAAQISLSTFGDYGDISVAGSELRHKLVPFYSWIEINWKYHANLFRNLRDAVAMNEASQGEALKAGSRAAFVFAAGMSRRAAGMFLTRLALPYLAILAWNNSGDNGDIEDELSEEDKRRFHIIVGRDDEGKAQVIYANTALADVLKWFSGPEFARVAIEYTKGNMDLPTALSSWRDHIVPDFINNTVGTLGPLFKTPVMAATRKSFFPDVTEPKNIPAYDFRRSILASMTDQTTADWIERAVNKDYLSPKDVGTWAKQAILQVRGRDAQSWAFYAIKDKAADFLEKRTGQKRDNSYDAPDQEVLRNFRRSLFRGDVDNAVRFYNRLLEYGYTAERFKASIRAQDPLAGVPRELRREFVDSLAPDERQMLDRAFRYYVRILDFKGDERRLFPRQGRTMAQTEALRARFTARPEALAAQMTSTQRLADEEIARQAQHALDMALRPARR